MRRYFEFASGTYVLAATFVATLAFLFLVFPNLPINGELLDLKPSYSYDEAMAALKEYGEDGRTVYAWASPTLDTLFPLVYVTLFAGLIYRFRLTEGLWFLAYLPVISGMFDLLENVQVTAMLISFPDISESQVAWASTATSVKTFLGPIYQLLGLGLLLIAGVRAAYAKFFGGGSGS
ncbi:MAG: hypothetical protein OXE81_01060 [Gammaproteobacteria bacterium]|nr:hypothetical protein [Gammaproteobacteria bacterium]MCY4323934.1 hypothetical protein [Gammaproteobacteria bacterium]